MELFNDYIPIIPVQNTEPISVVIKLKKANQSPITKGQRYHKIGYYPLNHFVKQIFCLFPLWGKKFAKSVSATPPAYYYSGFTDYPCWRLFDLLLLTKEKALNIKGDMDAAKARVEKAVAKFGGWERANQLLEKIEDFNKAGEFELAKQSIKAAFGYYNFLNDLRNYHLSYSYQNGLNVFEQSEILEKYLEFLNNLPALYKSFPPSFADEFLVDACKEAGYIF
jgi:tetratricopeptide (TPR) repeat protein